MSFLRLQPAWNYFTKTSPCVNSRLAVVLVELLPGDVPFPLLIPSQTLCTSGPLEPPQASPCLEEQMSNCFERPSCPLCPISLDIQTVMKPVHGKRPGRVIWKRNKTLWGGHWCVLLMFFFNLPPELSLNAADFQGDHTGHCLYLILCIRKLSGDKKSDHAHWDQQIVATLVDFKRREKVFCRTGSFILKHTLYPKDQNLVTQESA